MPPSPANLIALPSALPDSASRISGRRRRRSRARSRARRRICSGSSTRMAIGAASSSSIARSAPISCSSCIGWARWTMALQQRCVRHILKRQLRGWRLEYLLRRAERGERLGQSLLRAEARRPFRRSALHAGSARQHSAPRRHPADEHLQQALSGAARAISLAISALHSGGDDSAAELVAV